MPITGRVITSSVQVTLTDAQIKSMPSDNNIIIVPSPGSGKGLLLLNAVFTMNLAVAYTNYAQDTVFGLQYSLGQPCSTLIQFPGGSTGQLINLLLPALSVFGEGNTWQNIGQSVAQLNEQVDSSSLNMYGYSALGDLTGGDSANSLKVLVNYLVFGF